MWWLFNVNTQRWIICLDECEADSINRFVLDYPWLELRKRYETLEPF